MKTVKVSKSGMGRPVRVIVPPPKKEETSWEEIEAGPSDQEVKDEERLQTFQEQFGGDEYSIRVQKYNDEERELEYVDKVRLDGFDPFLLGKKFGGGRYVCTLFNDKGKYVEGGRFHFKFAKPVLEEKRESSPFQDPAVLMFLEQAKNSQAMLMEILKTSLTGEKQTPVAELIAGLKGLHDLSPKEKADSPFKNLREMLEMQSLLRESSGADDDKGGGTGIMSELLQALKVMGQMKTLPAPPPAASAPQRSPVRTVSPTNGIVVTKKEDPINEEEKPVMIPAVEGLKKFVPMFEDAAANNEDPEKWAPFLFDIVDLQVVPALVKQYSPLVDADGVWEKLIAASEDETEMNKIFVFAPGLESYRDWVIKVVQAAVRLFDDGEEPEIPKISTPVNGDAD